LRHYRHRASFGMKKHCVFDDFEGDGRIEFIRHSIVTQTVSPVMVTIGVTVAMARPSTQNPLKLME
jgi:hypothetical protein